MAEIVDFGLQQYKIKMDDSYFDNGLSVVVGDTGRRIEVQLLDTNGMVQNTTGLNLRLNAVVEGKATFTDAILVDATTGKYRLDLSNGMFLAPGKWPFQWLITDSAGKKLHGFAFMGSIGSNLSEGGTQATNFYLNLEDLKAMQADFISGAFDSAVLETNIAEKLTDLETEYAPQLNSLGVNLAETNAKKLDKMLVIPADVNGHGVNISIPNIENRTYNGVMIDVPKYGILWNNGTVGGENLRITNSKIVTDVSDAIELNTFGLSSETNFFRNILVTDNFISTGLVGGSSAGFAVGAASPQNLIISNNVIYQSSKEGVHIEGLARNTIVSSNVIDNAIGDGVTVSGDIHEQSLVEPTTISNNAIRSATDKTGTGINIIYSTSLIYGYSLLNANKIIGFNRGLALPSSVDVSGTYVENCNTAINAYKSGIEISGVIQTKKTPNILNIGSNSIYEITHLDGFKTTDIMNVDNIITKPTATTVTMNKMSYRVSVVEKGADNFSSSAVVKIPKYFKGIIKLSTVNGGNFTQFTADCELKNGILTTTEIASTSGFSYGKVTLSIIGGYLHARFFTSLSMVGQYFNVSLDGYIVY